MKIRPASIFVAITLSLMFLQPLKVDARTSVYISVGLGGAAIVGGAYLFWSLSYGSRVSNREPETIPPPLAAYSLRSFENQRYQASIDQLEQGDSETSETLTVRWPLFTYRW
ncbi:MAG: hypothetical protein HZA19_02980 [Nitrospirae bacterium]|nr:hypothetical protein [Nitrospirota bacterium]